MGREEKSLWEEMGDRVLIEFYRDFLEEIREEREKKKKKVEKKVEVPIEEIYKKIKEGVYEEIGKMKEELYKEIEKIREEVYNIFLKEIKEKEEYGPKPPTPPTPTPLQEKEIDYQKELKDLEEKFKKAKEIKIMRDIIKKAREYESERGKGEEYKVGEYTAYLSKNAIKKFKKIPLRDFLLSQIVIADDYRKQERFEDSYVMLHTAKNTLDKCKEYILKEMPDMKSAIGKLYEMIGKRYIKLGKKVEDPNLGLYCVKEARECLKESEKYK